MYLNTTVTKRLAGKNVSKMTYFMSSGMQNLNSVNYYTTTTTTFV